jgi:hypothetical protein
MPDAIAVLPGFVVEEFGGDRPVFGGRYRIGTNLATDARDTEFRHVFVDGGEFFVLGDFAAFAGAFFGRGDDFRLDQPVTHGDERVDLRAAVSSRLGGFAALALGSKLPVELGLLDARGELDELTRILQACRNVLRRFRVAIHLRERLEDQIVMQSRALGLEVHPGQHPSGLCLLARGPRT